MTKLRPRKDQLTPSGAMKEGMLEEVASELKLAK